MVPTMKANVYKVQKVQTTLGVFTQKQPIVTNTSAIKLQGGCQSSTTPSEPEDLSETNTTARNQHNVEQEPEPTSTAMPQVSFENYQQMEGDAKTEQNQILGNNLIITVEDAPSQVYNEQVNFGSDQHTEEGVAEEVPQFDSIKFEFNQTENKITVLIDNSILDLRGETYNADLSPPQQFQTFENPDGTVEKIPMKRKPRVNVRNAKGIRIEGEGLKKIDPVALDQFLGNIEKEFGYIPEQLLRNYRTKNNDLMQMDFRPVYKEDFYVSDYPEVEFRDAPQTVQTSTHDFDAPDVKEDEGHQNEELGEYNLAGVYRKRKQGRTISKQGKKMKNNQVSVDYNIDVKLDEKRDEKQDVKLEEKLEEKLWNEKLDPAKTGEDEFPVESVETFIIQDKSGREDEFPVCKRCNDSLAWTPGYCQKHDQRFFKFVLTDAATQGCVKCCRYWIEEKGLDVNCKDESDGRTPLMHQCFRQQVNVVKYLITNHANELDLDQKQSQYHGDTALHLLARHARNDQASIKCFELLLNQGADINVCNNIYGGMRGNRGGEPVLSQICSKSIIYNGTSPRGRQDEIKRDFQLLNLLLSKKPDLSVVDCQGKTALKYLTDAYDQFLNEMAGREPQKDVKYSNTTSLEYSNRLKKQVGLLVKQGAQNVIDEHSGRSVLVEQAEEGNINHLNLFFDQGVSLELEKNFTTNFTTQHTAYAEYLIDIMKQARKTRDFEGFTLWLGKGYQLLKLKFDKLGCAKNSYFNQNQYFDF